MITVTLTAYNMGGEATEADFGPILIQDFSNMAAVQCGMKNGLFRGTLPNPYAEGSIVSLHRNLAQYMGTGAPQTLGPGREEA